MDTESLASVISGVDSGGLVCFPTETVYALAVRFGSDAAAERIYSVKKRPRDKPLALLLRSSDLVADYAQVDQPQIAFIKRFAPGPVTFVLKSKGGGRTNNTVGLRIPNHPVAIAILNQVEGGVMLATSANLSGMPPPRFYKDIELSILKELSGSISSDAQVSGTPSAVIDITLYPQISLLREGMIDFDTMRKLASI